MKDDISNADYDQFPFFKVDHFWITPLGVVITVKVFFQ
ncbi:hypothetical protein DSOL_2066 [Desulfosporosinus metallidurans]|uniref:Uncharacterized protein n=1 Tax=Desulfosporosinus metallidurans TaxID=1888891 RepID=A0A1Q8QXB0_9FIRM|nr:hypothetical protein DSOL_2066 [Desulfosporosinus metallidurans]